MTGRRHGALAFDLRGIADKSQRALLQSALNACDYPLNRIRRVTGVRVPVTVEDTSRYVETREAHVLQAREAALGLYWLPTPQHPAGRIVVGTNAIGDRDLAREVFLAEVAHCVDYAVMTDTQRRAVFTILHGGDPADHGTHGWWEERGGQDYWADWAGEAFMGLFVRAFAPSLPRPLEARQPWAHRVTDAMVPLTRRALR